MATTTRGVETDKKKELNAEARQAFLSLIIMILSFCLSAVYFHCFYPIVIA